MAGGKGFLEGLWQRRAAFDEGGGTPETGLPGTHWTSVSRHRCGPFSTRAAWCPQHLPPTHGTALRLGLNGRPGPMQSSPKGN